MARTAKSKSNSISDPIPKSSPKEASPSDDDFEALFEQLARERKANLAAPIDVPVVAPTSAAVNLEGELNIDSVTQLKTRLQQALAESKKNLTALRLDLSSVTECDGAGLQTLLALTRAAHAANVPIELLKTPPKMTALLDRYGVAGYFSTATVKAAP